MLFLLKKFAAPLLLPLSFCMALMFLGTVLFIFTRRKSGGKFILVIGLLLLFALSHRLPADALLTPLELKFSPIVLSGFPPALPEEARDVKYVVVLGGGNSSDPRISLTSQVSPSSLVRLAEGIRLQRLVYGSKLLVSGGAAFDTSTDAYAMERVAIALGVDRENIVTEAASKDTDDQARLLQPVLRDERFILVTSAAHMSRSVALFRKLGMRPVPAPTDYIVKDLQGFKPSTIYPTVESLGKSDRAIYEYAGQWWERLRGNI